MQKPDRETPIRLLHIDWARGLAVFMMIRGHVVNAFLSPLYRQDELFKYWQFLGGYTAPTFLFVAGLCLGLSYSKLDRSEISFIRKLWLSVKRGFYIFGVGIVLQILLYVQWIPYSDWKNLFKVDILNNIGLSLILLGLIYTVSCRFIIRIFTFTFLTLAMVFLTPVVWSNPVLQGLPWFIRGYFIGSYNEFGQFPLFPYFVFLTSGMVIGIIQSKIRNDRCLTFRLNVIVPLIGLLLILGGAWFTKSPANSPEFIFTRIGFQLVLISACYFLCLLFDPKKFSFMRLMGRHSLMIYLVHVVLVYGRVCQYFQQKLNWNASLLGILVVVILMVILAWFVEKRNDFSGAVRKRVLRQPL